MKPEAQRIAIAEACGWRSPFAQEWLWEYDLEGGGIWAFCGTSPEGERSPLPDYLNDLNAMHEAEIILNRGSGYHNNGGYGLYLVALDHDVSATAAKRAEAFLRTLNLWTDE